MILNRIEEGEKDSPGGKGEDLFDRAHERYRKNNGSSCWSRFIVVRLSEIYFLPSLFFVSKCSNKKINRRFVISRRNRSVKDTFIFDLSLKRRCNERHSTRINSFFVASCDNWFVPISNNVIRATRNKYEKYKHRVEECRVILDARDRGSKLLRAQHILTFLLVGYVAPVGDGLRGRHKRSCPAICRCALSRNRGRAYSSRWDMYTFSIFHFLCKYTRHSDF